MTNFSSLHSPPKIYVIRLKPREDLKQCIRKFAVQNNLKASVVVSCVGSLLQYNLRFANQKDGVARKGHFEILSLSGTISDSAVHLHLSIANEKGETTGGHLLDENLIFTTAEIAIAELTELEFERVYDPDSGYPELHINSNRKRHDSP